MPRMKPYECIDDVSVCLNDMSGFGCIVVSIGRQDIRSGATAAECFDKITKTLDLIPCNKSAYLKILGCFHFLKKEFFSWPKNLKNLLQFL